MSKARAQSVKNRLRPANLGRLCSADAERAAQKAAVGEAARQSRVIVLADMVSADEVPPQSAARRDLLPA